MDLRAMEAVLVCKSGITARTVTSPSDRLSISHLMLLTAGIGVALFVARGIEHLRFRADAHYYNLQSVSDFDAFGMLVAGIYGLSVTMLLFAIKSGDFWSSPGKTLALLFATMCLLNWGLELIAASVTYYRLRTELVPGVVDDRGYIFGVWYRRFAVDVGYVACIPILLWVLYKTRCQRWIWRLAWAGFLFFAVAINAHVHFDFGAYLPRALDSWYFETAIGLPICLLIVAVATAMARREGVDWWTAITVVPVCSVWCIGLVLKSVA